jgi:integrase
MVLASAAYVSPGKARRTSINKEDKSWTAMGVDVASRIEDVRRIDPRVAVQLDLGDAFGLRPEEQRQLRPHLADRGTFLAVNWGTKGGRDRVVGIETLEQREVLNRAKAFAATLEASMCDPQLTLRQAKGHYYRVMAKCGITKEASNITAYGLRHAKSSDRYKAITGVDSPVRGGGQVDPVVDRHARRIIAEELGHSRTDITTFYIGRRRHG